MSDGTKPPSRGQITRARILEAAERHFSERGFANARLEDIAAEIGFRRAAIFYHFADKQDLYDTVVQRLWTDLHEKMRDAFDEPADAAQSILAATEVFVDYVADRHSVARIVLREAADQENAGSQALRRLGGPIIVMFRDAFEQGEKEGSLRPIASARHYTSAMTGMISFFVVDTPSVDSRGRAATPLNVAEYKAGILAVLRNLLGVESTRSRP